MLKTSWAPHSLIRILYSILCSAGEDGDGDSDEDVSSEDESLASEGDDDSEYALDSDEEEGGWGGVGCDVYEEGGGTN